MENGMLPPINEPPQDIFLHFIIASLALFITFTITSALIESAFCYIFLGDFVKRFRRYFLSFLLANFAVMAIFIGLQIILNSMLSLDDVSLLFLNILTVVMFVLPFIIKFIVIRLEFNKLTKRNVLSKPISNKALIILFVLGTLLSLTINYFIVFPALNWML